MAMATGSGRSPVGPQSERDLPVDESTPPWVDGLTIGQVLRETARRSPQSDAYVFCHLGARRTWQELDKDVDQVARGLLALGFRPGDHLGIWATNVPEWIQLQFATARIGVVLVTINPAYRTSELCYALKQSEVKGIACIDCFKSSNFVSMIQEACPEICTSQPGQISCRTFPKLRWSISLRGERPPGT